MLSVVMVKTVVIPAYREETEVRKMQLVISHLILLGPMFWCAVTVF